MTRAVRDLLDEAEGTELELKERFPASRDIAATLCAFANSAAGDLLIGISDGLPRTVVGVPESVAVELERKVSSIAANNISPRIVPTIRLANVEGRHILAIHVQQGYQRPYQVIAGPLAGSTFVRIGSSTRRADSATIERLRLESRGLSWDTLPCHDLRLEDLSPALIDEFLQTREERRGIAPPRGPRERWLKRTRLAVDVGGGLAPTIAALLLFHARPGEILPRVGLEMARFRGTRAAEFLDKRSVDLPVWKLYNEALTFLRKHLPVKAVRGERERSERFAYPVLAFRELMINALCHRSYEPGTGPVRLAVFDDLIEITSSGPIPEGLELTDLGTGISMLGNPVLARALNELGLIEGWGTGIRLALQELADSRLPPARFSQKGFFTQVSSVWRWPSDLSADELAILRLVASKEIVSSAEVATHCNCSARTARNRLAALVGRRLLHKRGATKGAVYTLGERPLSR